MQDPTWKVAFDEVTAMNEQITKAVVQNPLEYRAIAMIAAEFGSRPHDLEIDAEHAAGFCHRLMS